MPYTAISVGVPNSILRQSTMAQSDYPNLSFPPRCTVAHLCIQVGIQGENSLVRECITFPWGSCSPHLMTRVATEVGLCPCLGLCSFSWCLPRDAKNCHALNMMCAWQRPHTQLSVTPNMMHTGTNQKAQQSCGSSTNREWSDTPGSRWDTWGPHWGHIAINQG